MEISEAKKRLRAAGWSMAEASHIQGEIIRWTVTCNRKGKQLAAVGGNRPETWQAAMKMTADADGKAT